MAFDDILARDPKSEKDFWTIIEKTFVQVEAVLVGYRVESKEEALDGTLRKRDDGDTYRSSPGDFIRYRGVDKDYGSRDYFLELGQLTLPEVKQQIEARTR
jgi:hypothetical protein